MTSEGVDFGALQSEYSDPASLGHKKIRLVNRYIPDGGRFLDIGMGTGDLIALRIGRHRQISGIDCSDTSVDLCGQKFGHLPDILLSKGTIEDFHTRYPEPFDCITCLDVLEHIEERDVAGVLHHIHDSLARGGIFIFTGPGIFEKARIFFGRSPGHLHSHSSYGWKSLIETAGFKIISVESVEFPLIRLEVLRKNLHLLGKCCLIVARKAGNGSAP
jgi:predicted TPR repeat methyltransferase